MATRSVPATGISPAPAPIDTIAAKCTRAYALLEEAWDLINEVLDEAGDAGALSPAWQARIPPSFPEAAVEPLCHAIIAIRPDPAFATRAELETAAEAQDAVCH